jgi:hypothetical protein
VHRASLKKRLDKEANSASEVVREGENTINFCSCVVTSVDFILNFHPSSLPPSRFTLPITATNEPLSASTTWRKSRTSEKDWRGMMEASLKKHDFSNFNYTPLPSYKDELVESFQESFAAEVEPRARDLLYTKSAVMPQPVDRVSQNTNYAAVASSPFARTLREEFVLGERTFKREQEKKEERKQVRMG